jgi:hypothetical protein
MYPSLLHTLLSATTHHTEQVVDDLMHQTTLNSSGYLYSSATSNSPTTTL